MKRKDFFLMFFGLFGVIGVDQASKQFVLKTLPQVNGDFLHISLHFNKGAMLGLFSDLPPVLRIVSLSTGGAFLLFSFFILQYLLPTRSISLRLGMSILLGGILGNVIDRIVWGHVVDFIMLSGGGIRTGVFNVADALQWVGYFMMGHALVRDKDNLWPKDNLRKASWINPKFQLRYCYILVTCGLGFSIIAGVFSYTFLRFVVIDLIGNNEQLLDQFLKPFLITFSTVSLAFTTFLFLVGKQLSHRIVGPVYAFEKFIDNYINGHEYKLRLRKGDEFPEFEDLAEKIAQELRTIEPQQFIPILPEGHKQAPDKEKKSS